jgi:hypothetical protein
MKTAMMSVSPPGGGGGASNSAALESAVDAYATRVLASKSPPEAFVDTSLGPYVTALLRCADLRDQEEVTSLSEFESLVELLEDQCSMRTEDAESALKSIAIAVCTGAVPSPPQSYEEKAPYMDSLGFLGTALHRAREEESTTTTTPAKPGLTTSAVHGSPQLYGEKASYTDSFNLGLLGTALHQARDEESTTTETPAKPETTTLEPYTPHSLGGPSPLKPDNLIPVDLLGALDDETPHFSRTTTRAVFQEEKQQQEQQARDADFPTLGAAAAAPVAKKNDKAGGRKKASKKHADKDLAAALFRPSRARQNSIAEDESPKLKPSTPAVADHVSSNQYYQQQWDSSVEILLSMSPDLSEEAAKEASRMAKTDFNIAQHIVDTALSAPPICRHMLHDGCYRSDCQFSHDVEGHTCVFWLRGRCGKGSGCKFLHGFNDKILDGIKIPDNTTVSRAASSMISAAIPIASSIPKNGGWGGSSFQPSSAPSSGGGFGGFSLPASGLDKRFELDEKLVQSWNKPSPMKEMLSAPIRDDTGFSFAKIASNGYDQSKFPSHENTITGSLSSPTAAMSAVGTVRIPQDLWNAHENRDSSFFHIPDPLDRYHKVSLAVKRKDIVDLHFQSTKTFPVVLSTMLPEKLGEMSEVWIVTGTGHHVGGKTHQKGGGALERAVIQWLSDHGYNFLKGRDRNGLGGALLIKR